MSTARVICHFLHPAEEAAALRVLGDPQRTDSYVIGVLDEGEIEALRAQGLMVQVLDAARGPALPAAAAAEAALAAGAPLSRSLGDERGGPRPAEVLTREAPVADLATEGDDDERGAGGGAGSEPGFFLVSLTGPLLEEWRAELVTAGVEVLERAAGSSYVVRMPGSAAGVLMGLPFVSGLTRYGVGHTVAGGQAPAQAPDPGRSDRLVAWDLWLHRAEDRPAVEADLAARGVRIAGSGGRKVRIEIADGPDATGVAGLPEVARMETFVPPVLHNDVARTLLGIDRMGGGSVKLTGRGQIVGVADTGLDATHPDFAGRIAGSEALGRPGDSSDPDGHGTHVAGSVLGDGSASDGALKGVAPRARLYFQSLLDPSGGLGGLPVNLETLFGSAYEAGARIHNNSWGSRTASRYTIDATEVDAFVAAHRDMLIVVSAGNDGLAEPRANAAPGFVDWLSIGSPAACKNALTVGAARSGRSEGGYAALTWGEMWPAAFPAPPIGAERVSGDTERLAAFSSRGPCDDRRIKPDVVAPGTDILSTRSVTAPLRNFWGAHANTGYAYLGGTSMAAPLVAGTAALVREYLVERRDHQPSAALLKAILVNGTRWLGGPDSVADFADCPNYHQGFGAVHLPWSIPTSFERGLKLEFVDGWQPRDRKLERTGQAIRHTVRVTGGQRLRICLAYTDLPGRGLQNNLNLTVEGPTGQRWLGNEHVPMGLNIPDPDNNIEVVRIDDPEPGDYLIQVSAWNLLQAPQDFALAVAGNLRGTLKAAR